MEAASWNWAQIEKNKSIFYCINISTYTTAVHSVFPLGKTKGEVPGTQQYKLQTETEVIVLFIYSYTLKFILGLPIYTVYVKAIIHFRYRKN